MDHPIKLRNTLALLFAVGVGAVGLARGVSADLHVPAARILVAECQGFEALATAGNRPLTCSAAAAPDGAATTVVAPVVEPRAAPAVIHSKA